MTMHKKINLHHIRGSRQLFLGNHCS